MEDESIDFRCIYQKNLKIFIRNTKWFEKLLPFKQPINTEKEFEKMEENLKDRDKRGTHASPLSLSIF